MDLDAVTLLRGWHLAFSLQGRGRTTKETVGSAFTESRDRATLRAGSRKKGRGNGGRLEEEG